MEGSDLPSAVKMANWPDAAPGGRTTAEYANVPLLLIDGDETKV